MNTRDESKVAEPDATVDRVGRELAAARAHRRLTQHQVARLARTSLRRVSAIENGRETPRLDTLAKVAGAVGLRVALVPDAA